MVALTADATRPSDGQCPGDMPMSGLRCRGSKSPKIATSKRPRCCSWRGSGWRRMGAMHDAPMMAALYELLDSVQFAEPIEYPKCARGRA